MSFKGFSAWMTWNICKHLHLLLNHQYLILDTACFTVLKCMYGSKSPPSGIYLWGLSFFDFNEKCLWKVLDRGWQGHIREKLEQWTENLHTQQSCNDYRNISCRTGKQHTLYCQKYADTRPSYPYVGLPQTSATKLEAHNCRGCLSML